MATDIRTKYKSYKSLDITQKREVVIDMVTPLASRNEIFATVLQYLTSNLEIAADILDDIYDTLARECFEEAAEQGHKAQEHLQNISGQLAEMARREAEERVEDTDDAIAIIAAAAL